MPTPSPIDLSVVAPAHNEQDNIQALVVQVERALSPTSLDWEFIIVDDGSTDQTRAIIQQLIPTHPRLRCIAMTRTPPGRGNGQSAAFHAGFRAARGRLIAVLDADLQNDPAEIPRMLDFLQRKDADMVQGDRSHARKDNAVRRVGSIVGRAFRRLILADTIRDTGCSLRLMKREIALALPLEFAGMHRFIPVTARHLGFKVVEMPVAHRPRTAGQTKYGFGITKRAIPGLIDCFAVRYMRNRRRPTASEEAEMGRVDGGRASHGELAFDGGRASRPPSETRTGA
jgi:dolichol-phosphate mannosyltransferase